MGFILRRRPRSGFRRSTDAGGKNLSEVFRDCPFCAQIAEGKSNATKNAEAPSTKDAFYESAIRSQRSLKPWPFRTPQANTTKPTTRFPTRALTGAFWPWKPAQRNA